MAASCIAAQMYTLRAFTKTPSDIAATCARVRKIGYEAIQLSAFGPCPPAEVARILKGEGLVCCASHISLEEMTGELPRIIEEHKLWNCRHTAMPWLPETHRSSAGYESLAKLMSTAAKTLAAAGISLSYHHHAFELERFGKTTGLEILLSHAEASVLAEFDTYWIQAGGGDAAAWIARYPGRQKLIHLKDMVGGKNNQSLMAEIGEGNLSWAAILAAAKKAGVEWYIVEQDECQRDPFESLKISLENLRAMGLH